MVEIFDKDELSAEDMKQVGEEIRNGSLVVYPTESSYGLGTNALDKASIKEIYRVKERPKRKKLTVIVSNLDMALKYSSLNEREIKLCKELMPGPLTILAEKKSDVPDLLNDKFAFRISSHDLARNLAEKSQVPLIATSANVSGEGSVFSIDQLDNRLREKVDYIIDSGNLTRTPASTIIDINESEVKIIRQGPISREKIEQVLR